MVRQRHPAFFATFILFVSFCAPPVVRAQIAAAPDPYPAEVSRTDSVHALRRARSEQARFERVRRTHLPWTSDSWGGECDERIGRFCLWHGDGEDDWEPPPEEEPVTAGRERLLSTLLDAAATIPGDGWVAGHLVGYLVDADRPQEAIAAAEGCRAERWWCRALAGFAYHTAGEWKRAESAFDEALAAMPEEERRKWTDLSILWEHGESRAYRRASAAEQDSIERRFWWLADPLYMIPGNERRTEHLSRWVRDQLQTRSRFVRQISWGDDLQELLVRYGWPTGWERIRQPIHRLGTTQIVGHHPSKGRRFVPPASFVEAPFDVRADEWPLEDDRARAEYAPPYASSVEPLDHQLALFRDGDSVTVVAAYELADSAVTDTSTVDAALILARDERSAPIIRRLSPAERTGTLHLAAPTAPTLVSLEALVEPEGIAGRARFGIDPPEIPPDLPAISDLLLIEGSEPLPENRSEAIGRALGSFRIRAGTRFAIFWEVYNAGRDADAMEVSLTLTEAKRSWFRKLAERTGLVRVDRPIRLEGQEEAPEGREILTRSMALEMPDVDAGDYTLTLTLRLPGREPLVASRLITVVP